MPPPNRAAAAAAGAAKAGVMAAGAVAALVMALAVGQSALIYHPRRYGSARAPARFYRPREDGAHRLRFHTSQGAQTAFYLPPLDGRPRPNRVWLMLGGNAMLALDWRDTAEDYRRRGSRLLAGGGGRGGDPRGAAFVMVDYPGYGHCEGKPGHDSIAENVLGAARAAHEHAGTAGAAPPTGLLAHSLGCAAALRFASDEAPRAGILVDRAVLMSPFVSLLETARHHLSWLPLPALLLRHRFDNAGAAARLAAARGPSGAAAGPVRVTVVHGDEDAIVPHDMGRRLAAILRERAEASGAGDRVRVDYVEVPGAGHNDIFEAGADGVYAAMDGADRV